MAVQVFGGGHGSKRRRESYVSVLLSLRALAVTASDMPTKLPSVAAARTSGLP